MMRKKAGYGKTMKKAKSGSKMKKAAYGSKTMKAKSGTKVKKAQIGALLKIAKTATKLAKKTNRPAGRKVVKENMYKLPVSDKTLESFLNDTPKKTKRTRKKTKRTRKKAQAGKTLKKPTAKQVGLKKLPTAVRNKMGYAKKGKTVKKARYGTKAKKAKMGCSTKRK